MARKSTGRTGKKSNVRGSSSTRSRDNKKSSSERESSHSSSHRGAEDRKVVSISRGREQNSARGRSSGGGRSSGVSRPKAHALTDHDEIRQWAEERGANPAYVRGAGDREDLGMIRLDFPGPRGEGSLEEIDWDEWFDKFDESGLALLVQEQTSGGQKSNFNKLVKRETAEGRGGESSGGGRSPRGRTA
jgi:hypothetical protein